VPAPRPPAGVTRVSQHGHGRAARVQGEMDRTTLCVVRTWMEEGSTVLRAEISVSTDLASGSRRRVAVTGAGNVNRFFRAWLSEVAADAEPPFEQSP
jgi:ABC-type nitrate/sulfonate/bicarbonate transport system substrate-binding protein